MMPLMGLPELKRRYGEARSGLLTFDSKEKKIKINSLLKPYILLHHIKNFIMLFYTILIDIFARICF